MKFMLKWVGIFILPSILFFLYIQSNYSARSDSEKALFFVFHFLLIGAAIYFTLTELKKRSVESVSALRYIMTGIVTSISFALLFGLFSGLYFNVMNPNAQIEYVEKELEPALIRGMDSTVDTREAYYNKLMEGKDSGVLLPDRYAMYQKAANDSLAKLDQTIAVIVKQNFSFSGSVIRWVGFAPLIGILFSIIVTVFVTKR